MAEPRTWYVVLSRGRARLAADDPRQVAHRAWLLDAHRQGRALFSGPTEDGTTGIYILLAEDLASATRLVEADPLHRDGVRNPEIHVWRVRRGFRLSGPTPEEIERIAASSAAGPWAIIGG